MARAAPPNFDASARPELPELPGLLFASDGRGAGKTIVAAAVARHLRRLGRDVEVFKPLAARCRRGRGGLISPDADLLAACAESKRTLAEISPIRYASTLPAAAAATIEHWSVDLAGVFDAWRALAARAEVAVVESDGGLADPITDEFWPVHLAKLLALPVVLVVRAELGCVNRALQAMHLIRSMELNLAGVVLNRYRPDAASEPAADAAMRTAPDLIARSGRVKLLALIPDDPANNVDQAAVAPSAQHAVDQVPWERIIFGRS